MTRQMERPSQEVGSTASAVSGMEDPVLPPLRSRVSAAGDRFAHWVVDSPKAVYGSSVTRILLGITGLGVLLVNFPARHYLYGVGSLWNGEVNDPPSSFPNIWLFSVFRATADNPTALTTLYIFSMLVASLVTIGWRARLILPLHLVLWVSLIELNDSVSDQSDNAYRIFLLLLIFTRCSDRLSLDARRDARSGRDSAGSATWIVNALHNFALIALVFQVCAIYVSGGFYKLGGESWQQGYAAYLPLQTAQFGTWPEISQLITAWGPAVVIASWGSICIQIFFPFLLLRRATRIAGLLAILLFHCSVAFLMGIPWFSLVMIAVDAILVRDATYVRIGSRMRLMIDRWRSRLTAPAVQPQGDAIDE